MRPPGRRSRLHTWLKAAPLALLPLCLWLSEPGEHYPGHRLVQGLGQRMAERLEAKAPGPIALAPAGDQNLEGNPLSELIGDDFVVAAKKARPGLSLIERQRLSLLLDEQKLDTSGLIDPSQLRRVSRVSGARALVHVVVVPLSEKILVRALAWDVETAEILEADDVAIPRSPDLLSLLPAEKRAPAERGRPIASQVASDIRFELLGCKRRGRVVTCTVDLVSPDRDQTVRLYRQGTYIADAFGGHYPALDLNTGKKIGWKLLLKGVPARFRVEFGGVPREVNRLKVLEVKGKNLTAEFRDVRIG